MRLILMFAMLCGLKLALITPASLAQDTTDKTKSASNITINNSKAATAISPNLPTINQATELRPSTEEIYALQKLKIQRELEDELTKWAQTKFWLIALFTVAVGFFGVRALVREMTAAELKDATRASAEAQAAAQMARESIKDVRLEAGKYKELVENASDTATTVNEKLHLLQTRIDAEGARSVAAADLKIVALNDQIEALRNTVESLASDSERSREIIKLAEARLTQAREAAQTSEAEFESNADINILVVHHPKVDLSEKIAKAITDSLTQKGFKLSGSSWSDSSRIGHEIRVNYQPIASAKIKTIKNEIQKLLKNKNLKISITFAEDERPISNNPNIHVAIFLE